MCDFSGQRWFWSRPHRSWGAKRPNTYFVRFQWTNKFCKCHLWKRIWQMWSSDVWAYRSCRRSILKFILWQAFWSNSWFCGPKPIQTCVGFRRNRPRISFYIEYQIDWLSFLDRGFISCHPQIQRVLPVIVESKNWRPNDLGWRCFNLYWLLFWPIPLFLRPDIQGRNIGCRHESSTRIASFYYHRRPFDNFCWSDRNWRWKVHYQSHFNDR